MELGLYNAGVHKSIDGACFPSGGGFVRLGQKLSA